MLVITVFYDLLLGISVPFLGTVLGSLSVMFSKKSFNPILQRALEGFAAGVMVAASVWSLLIPDIEFGDNKGALSFVPALFGLWLGIIAIVITERLIMMLSKNSVIKNESSAKRTFVTALAVALHNFPEGMAVGVVYSGLLSGDDTVSVAGALALSVGIAVQNLPEGAVVSLPLRALGVSRRKAFLYGVLSGVVEPVGALMTVALSALFIPLLPYFLGFAAGAMIYVVVEELIPNQEGGRSPDIGTVFFVVGFSIMMTLDVAFG